MFYRILFFFMALLSQLSAETLNVCDAIERTLLHSPELRISSSEIDGKAGLQIQSLLYPNPIASYRVENVLGSGAWHGWHDPEVHYELAQLIELGGKRTYRYSVATYQVGAAEAGYEAKKISVLNHMLKAFIETAFAQEQLALAQEQKRVAQEVFNTVSAKVDAGKVSLIQQNKSSIALATAVITVNKALVDYSKAKEKLALFWESCTPDFDTVAWPFYGIEVPPCYDLCCSFLPSHPALIQAQFDILAAQQSLRLEQAEAVPDVTVTVGYKTEQRNGDRGLVFEASLPLPVFNQNQGNIAKECSVVRQTQDQAIALQLTLENRLSIAHKELMRAYQAAEQLRTSVLKSAEQSFQFAQEGYREGKFEYLDMLDSQRTLFDIKEDYIEALLFYHKSKVDIEYLIPASS